jgi:hypothetical protein
VSAGYGTSEHGDVMVWNESMNVTRDEFVDYDFNFSNSSKSYAFKPGYVYYSPVTGQIVSSLILKPYTGVILYKIKGSGAVSNPGIKRSDPNVLVYPNPASELLSLDIKENPEVTYEFYDSNGVLLLSGRLFERINTIIIQQFPKGIYFLKTSSDNAYHTEKIILQ